jgi:hypothetical protein
MWLARRWHRFLNRPLARPLAVYARWWMAAFVFIATSFAGFSASSSWVHSDPTNPLHFVQPPPGDLAHAFFVEHKWAILFSSLLVISIHFSYWSLLAVDTVFSRPVGALKRKSLQFPLLLLIGYFLGIVFLDNHVPTACVFLATYLGALIERFGEPSNHGSRRLPGDLRRRYIWTTIDAILVVALSFLLLEFTGVVPLHLPEHLINHEFFHALGVKDIVILVNLVGYVLAFGFARQDDQAMERLLCKVFLDKIDTQNAVVFRDLPPGLLPNSRPSRQIIDFGCSNSRRVLAALTKLGIISANVEFLMVGIDSDSAWKDGFARECRSAGVSNHEFYASASAAEARLHNVDLIIASHMLHERRYARTFSELLANSRGGALVMIFGCAPNSFLSNLMQEVAVQGMLTKEYINWDTLHLDELRTLANLENVFGAPDPSLSCLPYARIERVLKLDEDALVALTHWIEIKYGYRIALRTRELLERQVAQCGNLSRPVSLNFDDLVYVFRKAAVAAVC